MADKAIITVPQVDIQLLRSQRNYLLEIIGDKQVAPKPNDSIALLDGLVNLLDSMLDIAEGHQDPIKHGNWSVF